MEKLFNVVSVCTGFVGGFLCKYLGGFDLLLEAVTAMVVLDFFMGWLKARYTKKLSSKVGFMGILKKMSIFFVIVMAQVIQGVMGGIVPLREITIVFFIANEALSLLENVAELIPIPPQLKDVLLQLRDRNKDKESEE